MALLAIIGIALEILGFILIIKSTTKLVLKQGGMIGDIHVDPKTDKPPPLMESFPNPLLYKPGLGFVIAGLGLQVIDIARSDSLYVEISNFLGK